jgi:hypothetical protein
VARAAVPGRLTWLVATVGQTSDESATARTLTVDAPGWPGHQPGQHVTVKLTAEDGYSTQRDYSVASAPEPGRLQVTVQRMDDGEVSPYWRASPGPATSSSCAARSTAGSPGRPMTRARCCCSRAAPASSR